MRNTLSPEVLAKLLVSLGLVDDGSVSWSAEDGPAIGGVSGPCVVVDVSNEFMLPGLVHEIRRGMREIGYSFGPDSWGIDAIFNPDGMRCVRISRRPTPAAPVPGPPVFDLGLYEVSQVGDVLHKMGGSLPAVRFAPLAAIGEVLVQVARVELRPIGAHLYSAVRLKLEVVPEGEGGRLVPKQPTDYLGDEPEPTLDPDAPASPFAYATGKPGITLPTTPEIDTATLGDPTNCIATPIEHGGAIPPQDDPVPF